MRGFLWIVLLILSAALLPAVADAAHLTIEDVRTMAFHKGVVTSKAAMRAADRSGARVALVAGDRDIDAGTIGVKDLTTGEQVDVVTDSVVGEVLSRFDS